MSLKMHLNFTCSHVLFCTFLSCSTLSWGGCFIVNTKPWHVSFEAPSMPLSQNYCPPSEDDLIDDTLNIRYTKATCEGDTEGSTFYIPAAIIKDVFHGNIHQVVCTKDESLYLFFVCKFSALFSYKNPNCYNLLSLGQADQKDSINKLMLNSWVIYKKDETDSSFKPHLLQNPDINLVDDSFFTLVTHYYNKNVMAPHEPVVQNKFLEYVFLALHFCGSSTPEYLDNCIEGFGAFIQYAEQEESIPTVDDFFVQSQTVQENIRVKVAVIPREYLLELDNKCYICTLLEDKSLAPHPTDCLSIDTKMWLPVGLSLFNFRRESDSVQITMMGVLPKQPAYQ